MKFIEKILFLLFIILFGFSSKAQFPYFNNRYSFCQLGNWRIADGAVEVDNGYIITGNTIDTIENYWRRIGIMKIDRDGNRRWSKDFGDNKADYYTGYPGYLVKSHESGYYIAGTKAYWGSIYFGVGYLMRFDLDWDTVWTKEYNINTTEPYDTSATINQMDICNNGDIILTGGYYEPSIGAKIWLIRTDSLGNIIWTNSFGNNGLNHSYSVIQTTDGGFAIGGFWYIPGNPTATGDPIVIKTDSLGNQQWFKNLGGPHKGIKAMLSLGDDGNIIVGTVYTDFITGDDPRGRINIIKLDNQGNIIWNKKYGKTEIYNRLRNIRTLEDGTIIATGSVWKYNPWLVGWVIKVNNNGDSIWYREFQLLGATNSWNKLYDIIPTSDYGFLACGYVWPFLPDTGSQDAWVIKLDSLGCEYPFCDTTVGIRETDYVVGDGLRVYPNPANSFINFGLKHTGNRLQVTGLFRAKSRNCRLEIFDLYGRKVEETVVPPWRETVRIDVSRWNTGVYIAVLWDEDGAVGRKKFVVTH